LPDGPKPESGRNADLVERIQSVLSSKGLTLYQVSRRSGTLYGRSSPHFLPHNLYYDLRRGTFSPSIYQFLSLSRISGYRLADWLRVFGFDLEDIPRSQVSLPSKRTLLVDSWADPEAWVPWFRDKIDKTAVPPIAPLTQVLEVAQAMRVRSMPETNDRRFLYAKIGLEDALAFPDLVPGSIVRLSSEVGKDLIPRRNGTTSSRLFLVEHSKGLYCSRLRVIGDNLVVPVSTQLTYPQIELHVPHEARVLGVVDAEIRPMLKIVPPQVPEELANLWKPRPLAAETKIGPLLRKVRTNMNLSLREASAMSRRVAEVLGEERYFLSPSSLSDYEAIDTSPRHFHKAITLCSVYGLQFQAFLGAIGIKPEESGSQAMPDHLIPRLSAPGPFAHAGENGTPHRNGFLQVLSEKCEEIPFFLRHSVGALSGLTDASLGDFFWIGGERNALHPSLTNGLFVIVNRRKKRPSHFRSKPIWQQPLYVLQKRDGTYLCACCGIENDNLVVHPYSEHFYRPAQMRYHQDAEVVGEIVTIVRKLP
jgi:transcriptional regulator with XRE-family HTH domain